MDSHVGSLSDHRHVQLQITNMYTVTTGGAPQTDPQSLNFPKLAQPVT